MTIPSPLIDNTRLNYYNELNQLIGKAYFNLKQYSKALPYLEYYLEKQRKGTDNDYYQVAFASSNWTSLNRLWYIWKRFVVPEILWLNTLIIWKAGAFLI